MHNYEALIEKLETIDSGQGETTNPIAKEAIAAVRALVRERDGLLRELSILHANMDEHDPPSMVAAALEDMRQEHARHESNLRHMIFERVEQAARELSE